MSDDHWKSFASVKQLAWWFLSTDQGLRFLSWFLRKHWKRIMATEAGAAAYDWIRSKIEEEDRQTVTARRIVIERFPDGFLKVYAEKGDIVFVHRLKVESEQALMLEEKLARVNCPKRALEVYDGRVLATDFYVGRTVEQEASRVAQLAMLRQLSGRDGAASSRIDSKHRAGDNGAGGDRKCGTTGGSS